MNRHGILVAVVLSIDTGEKNVVGDRSALESDYALRVLFDDLSDREILQHLEGRILPTMSQQGRVCGVICKPTENTIVGLYCHDERDVTLRYQTSKILDAEIRELWASMAKEQDKTGGRTP